MRPVSPAGVCAEETYDAMSDFLLAMLLALAVLVVAFPVLRWTVRAEKRADDRIVMGRVYYPTRGHKPGAAPERCRRAAPGRRGNVKLIDLGVDAWDDWTWDAAARCCRQGPVLASTLPVLPRGQTSSWESRLAPPISRAGPSLRRHIIHAAAGSGFRRDPESR